MNKSESITKLSQALIEFHSKVPKVKKESENPFFKNKYASLSNILETISGPLNEAKLAVIQLPTGTNQLETILLHESGEYISEVYEMKPAKSDPQGQGSAITYQRRYALGAILSLNIDEDDDGNQASTPEKRVQPNISGQAVPEHAKFKIPEKAFSQLCDKLKANPEPVERGNLLSKTRRYYLPFSEEQENIISQIIDN